MEIALYMPKSAGNLLRGYDMGEMKSEKVIMR